MKEKKNSWRQQPKRKLNETKNIKRSNKETARPMFHKRH